MGDYDTYGQDGEENMEDVLESFAEIDAVDEAGAVGVGLDIPGIKPELRRLYAQHPELIVDYIESIMSRVPLKVAQPTDTSPDDNHTTYPFLTIYEKTKIIGLRANQLSQGARPFITVPNYVTDVRQIARLELEQKKIPFIIKRPLPNGSYEYWRLSDLMMIH